MADSVAFPIIAMKFRHSKVVKFDHFEVRVMNYSLADVPRTQLVFVRYNCLP